MEEDWDNLLILDACRYDIFKENYLNNGELQKVISAGSHTNEFLEENFTRGAHLDTVYVSATPRVADVDLSSRFHEIIHLWTDGWDDTLGTVPPLTVADRVRQVERKYPEKRLIAHFVQPHYPFIGEKGKELQAQIRAKSGLESESEASLSIWDHLGEGNISKDAVWQAYEENLREVLPVAEKLVEDLRGKSVITSDHGNSFGTLGIYGHPGKKFFSDLVDVPWLTVEGDERKERIREDQGDSIHHVDDEILMERLSDLGYKD